MGEMQNCAASKSLDNILSVQCQPVSTPGVELNSKNDFVAICQRSILLSIRLKCGRNASIC